MIKLGKKVKDKVTGFEGIATARCEYLNGCTQYCVEPKATKEGAMLEAKYIDDSQLTVVSKGLNVKKKDTGGNMPNAPDKC